MTNFVIARQGTIIDLINRSAAATGSMRLAAAASHADYNGHTVRVWFNDYRRYWIAEYHWAERVVLGRGSFENCLEAAMREFNRGAAFAEVKVTSPRELSQEQACRAAGLVPEDEVQAETDPKFAEVGNALWYERHFGIPATHFLIQARDMDEYKAMVDAEFATRRQRVSL